MEGLPIEPKSAGNQRAAMSRPIIIKVGRGKRLARHPVHHAATLKIICVLVSSNVDAF